MQEKGVSTCTRGRVVVELGACNTTEQLCFQSSRYSIKQKTNRKGTGLFLSSALQHLCVPILTSNLFLSSVIIPSR